MSDDSVTVEAVFDQGMLRPVGSLPLCQDQRVTITVQLQKSVATWPADVAAIYQEIADEDRRLADAMLPAVRETWPQSEEQP